MGHDAAFADLIAVPQRNLHLVPDALSDNVAVFTEPVAAACQIAMQATVRPDDRVVVLGDGRLGKFRDDRVVVGNKGDEARRVRQRSGARAPFETPATGASRA